MKDFTDRKHRNRLIAEEAAAWAVRLDGGDLSAKEHAALAQWLKESPRHVEELLLTGTLWAAADDMDAKSQISVESLLAAAENVVPLASPKTNIRHSKYNRKKTFTGIGLAAMLLLSTFIGVEYFYFSAPTESGQIYTTEIGEQRSFTLADGSVIHINTQSSLRVRYTDNTRAIDLLHGEAMFQVAKEAERPFQVLIDDSLVEALGTEFNLYRKIDGTQLTVVEGKVAVRQEKLSQASFSGNLLFTLPDKKSKPYKGKILEAGQATNIALNGEVGEIIPADINKTLSWRHRVLVFRNDPLSKVVDEFNRYNRVQIQLADTSLAATAVKAALNVDNPESLLKLIKTVDSQVTVDRSDKKKIIVHLEQ